MAENHPNIDAKSIQEHETYDEVPGSMIAVPAPNPRPKNIDKWDGEPYATGATTSSAMNAILRQVIERKQSTSDS